MRPSRNRGTTTLCWHKVSGSFSLPEQGFFSPFPHGTCSLSVIDVYLALGGGPPGFKRSFTCSVLLGIPLGGLGISRTGLSPSLGHLSRCLALCFNAFHIAVPQPQRRGTGLGFSPFVRHYLGNHGCFLFLRLLRCFTSPGVAPYILWIQMQVVRQLT